MYPSESKSKPSTHQGILAQGSWIEVWENSRYSQWWSIKWPAIVDGCWHLLFVELCSSKKDILGSWFSIPYKVVLFWDRLFMYIINLNSNPVWLVSLLKGKFWTHRHIHREKAMQSQRQRPGWCIYKPRNWKDCQGTPRNSDRTWNRLSFSPQRKSTWLTL
jgi:hypothetical protein